MAASDNLSEQLKYYSNKEGRIFPFSSLEVHVLNHGRKEPHPDPSNPQVVAPYGAIEVKPSKETPNFEVQSRPELVQDPHSEDGVGRLVEKHEVTSVPGRQSDELFTHTPPTITYAEVDNSLRHVFPTMVGIAMQHLGAEHDTPQVADDLSKWSSRLSKKAVSRGLALPNPSNVEMGISNDMDLGRYGYAWVDGKEPFRGFEPSREVPAHEVTSARNWVRSRIKGKRGEQFEQPDERSESKREWQSGRINPGPGQGGLF